MDTLLERIEQGEIKIDQRGQMVCVTGNLKERMELYLVSSIEERKKHNLSFSSEVERRQALEHHKTTGHVELFCLSHDEKDFGLWSFSSWDDEVISESSLSLPRQGRQTDRE